MQVSVARRHVIWDWNGTLLNDFPLIVEAVNDALRELGEGPIDAEAYRDHYTRPVQLFYERLLGRPITQPQWQRLDECFHVAYRRRAEHAPLARDGWKAIRAVAHSGATQSLLSMLRHDDLMPALRRHGVDRPMLRIDGLREGRGDRKAPHLGRHLTSLHAQLHADRCAIRDPGALDGAPADDPPARPLPQSATTHWVMIGDSLDDALAAAEHGLPCVLYDGGCHHRAELEQAGVPVAESLIDALKLAGWPVLP